ncbi:MAG TPA: TetR/AcrR family transcriptional regulator [Intrasporangium sp.]|uniref:TetR/AcrR family transcriptional regulator n=1 Tax=Intrasporangium sp. TaxID=1925024 RepID=UPI002B491BBC|nr:TetR/AcrR family transcriptional regulator [Intrasporangium sp.]HKX68015.1 TetR/AcrR family transcriptional regulator [Intrasporangium sp.]
MTDAENPGGQPVVADGRSVRWVRHREERRASLVDSTIRAIRRHGAGVGMDDIAAEARTSKTVIYRHFDDRAGLYRAVVERVDERVVGDVVAALKRSTATGTDPRELISSTVGAYLALVESDTHLYRFVVNRPMVDRPLTDDPVGATVGHVTDQLARLFEASSSDGDVTAAMWRVRAVALVGAVQAVADEWLASPGRVPRAELVESLTEFVWRGLAPVLSSQPEVAAPAVEERR